MTAAVFLVALLVLWAAFYFAFGFVDRKLDRELADMADGCVPDVIFDRVEYVMYDELVTWARPVLYDWEASGDFA